MPKISVKKNFQKFINNLDIDDFVVNNINNRYKKVTKQINNDFWEINSENMHSFYVGSYGRGTAIDTKNIDIIVELPWNQYIKYDSCSGNGQYTLLRAIEDSLKKVYKIARIGCEGQVVIIDFKDGVIFKVIPTFKIDNTTSVYPDTHDSGKWVYIEPKAQVTAFNNANSESNNNLRRLCRMARSWNRNVNLGLTGILIDTMAYHFISSYEYKDKPLDYYDRMSRDFFKYIYEHADDVYWIIFGDNARFKPKIPFKQEAMEAYEVSLGAISAYKREYSYTGNMKWREIYGTKFPL